MIDILYALIISILIFIMIALSSLFVRYYVLVRGCYNQPSPYCRADYVCPVAGNLAAPKWIACDTQSQAVTCATCPNNDCSQLTSTCPDPWCITCALQGANTTNCTTAAQSCTRYDNVDPGCPGTNCTCKGTGC